MKQIFNQNGHIVVTDVPIPALNEYEILVKNIYSAVSPGTETSSIESAKGLFLSKTLKNKKTMREGWDFFKEQGLSKTIDKIKDQSDKKMSLQQLGYSCCGEVIKVGKKITDIAVGDKVACAGARYANHAEFVSVPRNLVVKIPKEVDLKSASFTTIGAITLQGIRRADVHIGDIVAVMGLGLLGQIAVQILTSFGCNVIGVDVNKERVELAKKAGLRKGFVSNEKLVDKILHYTDDIGVDSVLIYAATTSSEPVNTAMKICRKKGIVVVIGDVEMSIERQEFYKKELDFRISTSYGPGRYDQQYEEKGIDYPVAYVRWTENRNMKEFLRLLKEKMIDLEPLITSECPISEGADAYNILQSEKDVIGIVFSYPHSEKKMQLTTKISLSKRTIDKKMINIGVIGCGSFAKSVHLPNIKKIPALNLVAVSSKSGKNAKTTAEKFGAAYCTTEYKELLEDENIDLVIVTTRHNLHAPIIIEAAKAGKHIFTEKPIALNYKDCQRVYKAIIENNVNFTIGFNRRFSPLSQNTKRILEKRKDPMIVTIRVNSAGMNKNHWINDPVEGGGAILGEGCHFFDLCNWFINAEPKRIYAEMISANNNSIVNNNNITSTITYEDGSLASVVYTTIGNASYPKERIEIFVDGGIICINDFRESVIVGLDTAGQKLKNIEKGQFALLNTFVKNLKNEQNNGDVPTVKDGVHATVLSLKVLDALRTGKTQSFRF